MDFVLAAFLAFAAASVASAVAVITVRNPVHAALCLVLTFFSVACTWIIVVCVTRPTWIAALRTALPALTVAAAGFATSTLT